ncbi:MAG: sulfatase-like hydrolase/transferase [Chloroflexota bacterium]|nr:sulfatase-like hydrolase/transferase [Chloroflexota bacterium]
MVFDDLNGDELRAGLPRTYRYFASKGTVFPNYICENPQCGPARGTLLTGRASHNGIRTNAGAAAGIDGPTIVNRLKSVNYRTALFGKYLNGYGRGTPTGWDHFDTESGGDNKHTNEGEYITDYYKRVVLRWLDQNNKGSRFVYVAPHTPHTPFIPARRHQHLFKGFKARRGRPSFNEEDVSDKPLVVRTLPKVNEGRLNRIGRKRLQMLRSCDEMIMRIIAKQKQQNRLQNTFFVIVSDNGFLLGDHRLETKGRPYDASIRVPMLAMGPGLGKGETSQRLVAVQDVATTAAKVARVKLERTDGRDFRQGRSRNRTHVLIQRYSKNLGWFGLRSLDYLYVEHPTGEKEYYDLRKDPNELDNLLANWKGHTPRLSQQRQNMLTSQLRAAKGCRGATCP